jgi:SAM-dependent methyltransferase
LTSRNPKENPAMPEHSTATTVARWDDAARRPDHQAVIHPAGGDPDAYRASGAETAAEMLNLWQRFGQSEVEVDPDTGPIGPLEVLEFGVGDGRILLEWSDAYTWRRWGVDASDAMLDHMDHRAHELEVMCPNRVTWDGLAPLPPSLHPGQFDVVYAVTVLIHQPTAAGLVIAAQLAQLVTAGGLLLLGHPLYEVPREGQAWNDVTTWSAAYLEALAASTGLEVVECWESPGSWDWGQELGPYHGATQVLRRPVTP